MLCDCCDTVMRPKRRTYITQENSVVVFFFGLPLVVVVVVVVVSIAHFSTI